MIEVEKGFILKGVTIGEILPEGMVIAIDDDVVEVSDVAVLIDGYTRKATIKEAEKYRHNNKYVFYGLKEYENTSKINWINSRDIKKNRV